MNRRPETDGNRNIRAVRRPANGGAAVRNNPRPVQKNDKKKKSGSLDLKQFINFAIPQKFDFTFFMIVVILLAFGLIMLFSASYASAKSSYGDSMYYIKRQLIFAAIGFGAMIFLSFIDYRVYSVRPLLFIATTGAVVLMLLVKVIGVTLGGAERWIELFGIQFQPSELLKIVLIMVIAEYFQRNYNKMDSFKNGFFPILLRVGLACLLVIFQPHLSCTVIILITAIAMFIIGGAKWHHLALVAVLAVAGAFAIYNLFPTQGYAYVGARIESWLNPEADIQKDTYQTFQSLVTIGSGGMFGLGLGNSRQKYGFLPVTHNDFIFSVICEELGFVGAVALILLFVVFLLRGFYIASTAPDKFGMLLCAGIVIHITTQALLNIAVVSNAIPNTGISLPFISYGGTALVVQMAEMGIVLNISRRAAME